MFTDSTNVSFTNIHLVTLLIMSQCNVNEEDSLETLHTVYILAHLLKHSPTCSQINFYYFLFPEILVKRDIIHCRIYFKTIT